MPTVGLDLMINASYTLFLLAFLMRDILFLRIIYAGATVLLVIYFYLQSQPLWAVIFWNSLFFVVNIYWIAKLMFDRRPILFTDEQRDVWESALYRIHPRNARALFAMGEHVTFPRGSLIVEKGKLLDYVALIIDGEAQLNIGTNVVERIGKGHFIGSAMLLESKADFPSLTTIHATADSRMIVWKSKDLMEMIKKDNDFSVAFEATLGLDIAHLLERAWSRQALAK